MADNLGDRLFRAIRPKDPLNTDGPHFMDTSGTITLTNAGGGVTQVDDTNFVPGVSNLGPMGAYQGGRSVASGHIAAPAMNGSGILLITPGITATQWIISLAASGQAVVAGSAPAGQRVFFSSLQVVATGTCDFQWMSPSGVAMSGSMRLLPGAGFAMAGMMPNGPILMGSQQSAIYIQSAGTQNIGGVAVGWVA